MAAAQIKRTESNPKHDHPQSHRDQSPAPFPDFGLETYQSSASSPSQYSDKPSGFPFMESALPIVLLSLFLGAAAAILLFNNYFRKRRPEVVSISPPQLIANHKTPKSSHHQSKKSHSKSSHHASDKDQNKKHHPLDVNTVKGHGDTVSGLCFSSDGKTLATACADGVVRTFKLDDATSKSFKFFRINVAAGAQPAGVSFADDSSSLVVACHTLSGCSLFMYGDEKPANAGQQSKLPVPEIKWEQHKIHDSKDVLTLVGTTATYGSADGSAIVLSCSEGTDIKLWHAKTGKNLGNVDTNQLKNNMAAISPNGRFIAAAAFTADVKVWEIIYSKDGSVKEVSRVMQLKGHKSAVTWLTFAPNSEQIITASKDGTIRIWNINVRYHLDEDPKTLKVFPIPLLDATGAPLTYDRLSVSPDGKILAVTHATTLQWLSVDSGNILDTTDKAHDGDITAIAWTPRPILVGGKQSMVLASASVDKKVKFWVAPPVSEA